MLTFILPILLLKISSKEIHIKVLLWGCSSGWKTEKKIIMTKSIENCLISYVHPYYGTIYAAINTALCGGKSTK